MNMNGRQVKILIADDESGIRTSMACILELEGYDVQTAIDGYDAVEKIKNSSFDIAFLDIRMPGINGVEVFREAKKASPKTIVILMTAYAINDLIRDALKEGAYACLEKPYEIEDIITLVNSLRDQFFST